MKNLKTFLLLLFTVLFSDVIYAQFTGPGSGVPLYTVQEVKDDAMRLDRKDVLVKLKGFIVERINDEDYVFMDKTGKIKIELEDKYLPDFPFDESTELIITAEVDYDLLEGTELEVEKVIDRAEAISEN